MTRINDAAVMKFAKQLSAALVKDQRTSGKTFTKLADGSPEWMTEAIHKAHGDKMPDDFIYRFCEMTADALAELDDDCDEDAMRDAINEIEPPCYTHDQMEWFSENWEYCDQAISDGLWTTERDRAAQHGLRAHSGQQPQVTDLVAIGMQLHIQEVGHALLTALQERADEDEDDD